MCSGIRLTAYMYLICCSGIRLTNLIRVVCVMGYVSLGIFCSGDICLAMYVRDMYS